MNRHRSFKRGRCTIVCMVLLLLSACARRPAAYFPENLAEEAQSVAYYRVNDIVGGDCDVYEVTEPAQVQAICTALSRLDITASTAYTAETEPTHTVSPWLVITRKDGTTLYVEPVETGFKGNDFVYYTTADDVSLILDRVKQTGTFSMSIAANQISRMECVHVENGTETTTRIDNLTQAQAIAAQFADVRYRHLAPGAMTVVRSFDAVTQYRFYMDNSDGTESLRTVTIYDTTRTDDGAKTAEVLVQAEEGHYLAVTTDTADLLQTARDRAAAQK